MDLRVEMFRKFNKLKEAIEYTAIIHRGHGSRNEKECHNFRTEKQ